MPLFAGLSDGQLDGLAASALYQRYRRGQTIFRRGEPGDRAFVIVAGTVDLVVDSPDGRELILTRLGPGEHFGEMALVDDLLRSATARAATPTELVVLLRHTFLDTLSRHPEVSMQIIRSLVQRLRVADDKLEAFAYLDAAGRVARTVLELDHGRSQPLEISHEELSHMAATSRQTTTRILGEWEEQGFVELSRRGILVTDATALTVLAQL
jgi:CRP/FNR family cyclic AMP-dependent transcriptional regulator